MLLSYPRFLKVIALTMFLQSCSSETSETNENSEQVKAPAEIVRMRVEKPLSEVKPAPQTEEEIVMDEENTIRPLELDSPIPDSEKDNKTEDESPEIPTITEQYEPFCLGAGTKDPEVVQSACLAISNRLASVTNEGCLAANLMQSQCQSIEQFPILYSEFSPLNGKQAQGKVLVVGGTHGDELTSVSMVFRWIEKLNQFHTGLFHWHMVPMMNPDGVLKSGATRTNANGIDLNRNLPSDDWALNALKYWREKTGKNERRYPGESPASEPETQWLIDEIESFQPDAIIAVHAPYGLVDFDAPVLNTAPKSLGRLMLNILGTYPGSLGNYAGVNRNIPVITLELPHAWVMPSTAETAKLWEDIVRWLRNNIDNPTPPVKEANNQSNLQPN